MAPSLWDQSVDVLCFAVYSGHVLLFLKALCTLWVFVINICNQTCYGGCWPVPTPGAEASVPEGVLPGGWLKGGGVSGSLAVSLKE